MAACMQAQHVCSWHLHVTAPSALASLMWISPNPFFPQIAVQIALIYAKIARLDFPREWPTLFQVLAVHTWTATSSWPTAMPIAHSHGTQQCLVR